MMKPTQFNYKEICFSDTDDCYFDETNNLGSNEDISPYFDIDIAMNNAYRNNESKIKAESIRPISNSIYSYYNSLNILVGNQGKGKTHVKLRGVIQISRLKDCNFHLIVYISKNGSINDSTFEVQQELIQLPIQVISDSNGEKYLKELDLYIKNCLINIVIHQK